MATNMYVKFGDIRGECEDIGHEKWCVITSLKQKFTIEDKKKDSTNPQRAKHSPIEITKIIDKAYTELLKYCRDGIPLNEVIIECVRDHVVTEGQAPTCYFQIVLKNVIVKEFQYQVNEGDLVSVELELAARQATYSYREQKKTSGAMVNELAFMQPYRLRDEDFGDAPDRDDEPTKGMGKKYRDAYRALDKDQKAEFAKLRTRKDKESFLDPLIAKGRVSDE